MRRISYGSWLRVAVLAFLTIAVGSCDVREKPTSLLLITVDTLRADRLGVYGGPAGLTPHLDALAERSIVFHSAYAPAPFTLPSVAALFTGYYPEEIGILSNEYEIPEQIPTLATEFRGHGYATGAVVSNFILRRACRLDRGFDHYDDEFPQLERNRKLPERTASFTTDAALRMLEQVDEMDRAFFLWVHYQDPHGPYTPPEQLRRAWLEREQGSADGARELPVGGHRGIGSIPAYQRIGDERSVAFYRAGYHGEIQHVDEQIGRLLKSVERRGLLERTVVAFAADHGEGLGEEDYWFAHGEDLTDNLTRVPLFMRLPSGETGARRDTASLIDLFATLRRLLLRSGPDTTPNGRDLLAPDAAEQSSEVYMASLLASSVQRIGVVADGYKFILSPGTHAPERLYRLGDETLDLARSEPELRATMHRRLFEERRASTVVTPVPQQPSEQDLQRLRSLGYVSDE